MFLLNQKPLAIDTAFTHDGISYPNNWLRLASQAERAAIGITEVADPAVYDDRYYWGVDNPKALEDVEVTPEGGELYIQKGLKSNMVGQVKQTAGSLLSPTDWYVTRKFERGVEIPVAVVQERAHVVGEADRLEAAIKLVTSVEELMEVMNSQNWGTK